MTLVFRGAGGLTLVIDIVILRGPLVARTTGQLQQFLERPPLWMYVAGIPVSIMAMFGMANRRGWPLGVVTGIVFAAIFLLAFLHRRDDPAWPQRQAVWIGGVVLGSLVFLLLATITSWPIWLCLLIGAAAAPIGVVRMTQLRRRQARTPGSLPPPSSKP